MASGVSRPGFLYWNRRSKEEEQQERIGTVVVLGWMLSKRKHLAPYARLFHSCVRDSLVCHPDVFNLWFPSRATNFALNVLDELVKELEEHPGPVVFAVFSGAHNAWLYKIIQILLGTCDGVDDDVKIGPIIFLCSENDKLAPVETVHIFA